MSWDAYHKAVGLQPNTSVARLCLEHRGRWGAALDLGCGNLRDSLHLQRSGFKRIVAVDMEEPPEIFDGIEFYQSRIEHFVPATNAFDLVVCCNTLFYVAKQDISVVFARIYESLASGGIFYSNLCGSKDEWVAQHGWVGHSEDEVGRLLLGFDSNFKRHTGKKAMANGVEKLSDTWTVRIMKK